MSFASHEPRKPTPSNALVLGLTRTDSWVTLHRLSKIADWLKPKCQLGEAGSLLLMSDCAPRPSGSRVGRLPNGDISANY